MQTNNSERESTAGNTHRTSYRDLFGKTPPGESNDPDGAARPPKLRGGLVGLRLRVVLGGKKKNGKKFIPPKGRLFFFGGERCKKRKDVNNCYLKVKQRLEFPSYPNVPNCRRNVGRFLGKTWQRHTSKKYWNCKKQGWIFSNIQRLIETWEILFGIWSISCSNLQVPTLPISPTEGCRFAPESKPRNQHFSLKTRTICGWICPKLYMGTNPYLDVPGS